MGKGQPHLGIRLEYPSFWDKTCPLCAFCNCFSIRTLRTQRPHWGFLHMASCLKMDYIPVNGKLNGKSMKMHLNNFEYMLMICLFGFWGTYFQTNIKKLTIRTIQKHHLTWEFVGNHQLRCVFYSDSFGASSGQIWRKNRRDTPVGGFEAYQCG